MTEGDLLVMSPVKRMDLYATFCRAFILSRYNTSAQDENLASMQYLANLWNWDESIEEGIHQIVAGQIAAIEDFIDQYKK